MNDIGKYLHSTCPRNSLMSFEQKTTILMQQFVKTAQNRNKWFKFEYFFQIFRNYEYGIRALDPKLYGYSTSPCISNIQILRKLASPRNLDHFRKKHGSQPKYLCDLVIDRDALSTRQK